MKFLDELKNWAQSIFSWSSSSLLLMLEFYFPRIQSMAWIVKVSNGVVITSKALETVAVLFVFSSVIYFIFSIILLLSFFSVLKKGQRKKNNDSNNTLKFTNQNTHTDQKKNFWIKIHSGTENGSIEGAEQQEFHIYMTWKWRQKNGILCAGRITYTRILFGLWVYSFRILKMWCALRSAHCARFLVVLYCMCHAYNYNKVDVSNV